MGKKRHPSPTWEQNLVSAQTDINRAVWAMNKRNDQKHKDDYKISDVKRYAEDAVFDLQATLEMLK